MALALLSTSCGKSVPQFPAGYIYEVDVKNNVCGEYKIIDYKKVLFEHTRDLPLSSCNGVFGFYPSNIAPVLGWTRDRISEAEGRCE